MSAEADLAAPVAADAAFAVSLPSTPYPGLRPFDLGEWPIFFGRERMADEVIAQLIPKRVLVVHGDSGCGKSSLVRAAVMSRLEQEGARCGVRWRTCAALPREAPLWNLAEALAGLVDGAGEDGAIAMRRALNCGAEAPAAVAELLPASAGDRFCILIDQFEELFAHARRHGDDEACQVTEFLIALHAQAESKLYVVLTMRSEFLGACARFSGFAELVNATQYLVPKMEASDLRRAIREPSHLFDGTVSADLADRLIADAGGGQDQLPLIQHGLMSLHRAHVDTTGPWQLGLEHYPRTGGLSGLLSDHADEVMARSGPPEVVEAVFRELTEINAEGQAIRRPRTLAQLLAATGAGEADVRKVVDAFRASSVSFLKPYGDGPLEARDLIDVSHEALIRCWRKLADRKDGWLLQEFRAGLIWQALLVQADSFERDATNVLGPVTTDERDRWFKGRTQAWSERYGGGWARVEALIGASVRERDRERAEQAAMRRLEERAEVRKFWIRLLTVLVTINAGISIFALAQWRSARSEAKEVNEQSAALWAAREESEKLQSDVKRQKALQDQTEKSASTLKSAAAALTKVVENDPELARRLQSVTAVLTNQAESLTNAAVPPPPPPPPPTMTTLRVYIQIANEGQRAAALGFEKRLESGGEEPSKVIVPGIELVKAPASRNVLRCFRSEDCRSDGPALVARMNALLTAPQIVLEDQSARYGKSSSIRPRQFELWLAPGDVLLK